MTRSDLQDLAKFTAADREQFLSWDDSTPAGLYLGRRCPGGMFVSRTCRVCTRVPVLPKGMWASVTGNLPVSSGAGGDPHQQGSNTYFSIRLSRRKVVQGDERMQSVGVCFGVVRTSELTCKHTRPQAVASFRARGYPGDSCVLCYTPSKPPHVRTLYSTSYAASSSQHPVGGAQAQESRGESSGGGGGTKQAGPPVTEKMSGAKQMPAASAAGAEVENMPLLVSLLDFIPKPGILNWDGRQTKSQNRKDSSKDTLAANPSPDCIADGKDARQGKGQPGRTSGAHETDGSPRQKAMIICETPTMNARILSPPVSGQHISSLLSDLELEASYFEPDPGLGAHENAAATRSQSRAAASEASHQTLVLTMQVKGDGKINFFEGRGPTATLIAQAETAFGGSCPGALLPFVSLLDNDIFCEVLSDEDSSAPPTLTSGTSEKGNKALQVRATSVLAGPHGFPASNSLSRAFLDWEAALDPDSWPASMDALLIQYATQRAALLGKKGAAHLAPSDLFDKEAKGSETLDNQQPCQPSSNTASGAAALQPTDSQRGNVVAGQARVLGSGQSAAPADRAKSVRALPGGEQEGSVGSRPTVSEIDTGHHSGDGEGVRRESAGEARQPRSQNSNAGQERGSLNASLDVSPILTRQPSTRCPSPSLPRRLESALFRALDSGSNALNASLGGRARVHAPCLVALRPRWGT